MDYINNLWNDEEGQGMAEYALILVLIAVVVMAVLGPLGTAISGVFTQITTKLGEK